MPNGPARLALFICGIAMAALASSLLHGCDGDFGNESVVTEKQPLVVEAAQLKASGEQAWNEYAKGDRGNNDFKHWKFVCQTVADFTTAHPDLATNAQLVPGWIWPDVFDGCVGEHHDPATSPFSQVINDCEKAATAIADGEDYIAARQQAEAASAQADEFRQTHPAYAPAVNNAYYTTHLDHWPKELNGCVGHPSLGGLR